MSQRSQAYAVVKALTMLSASGLAADCAALLGISALRRAALRRAALPVPYRPDRAAERFARDCAATFFARSTCTARRSIPFFTLACSMCAFPACDDRMWRSLYRVTNCGHPSSALPQLKNDELPEALRFFGDAERLAAAGAH